MQNYGDIMDGPFKPLYPYYAELIVERTGVTSGNLLDIGSNKGYLGFAIAALGSFSYIGLLDIKDKPLEQAYEKAVELGYGDICECITCSVEDMDLPDNCIDLAVSRGSMPFWEDQISSFREIYRVLKPGGFAYIGCGRGDRKTQADIDRHMEEQGHFKPEFPGQKWNDSIKRNSKTLPESDYIALFRELECPYAVVGGPDEGRWFIFSKPIE